jgi:hypothetical protein
MQVLSLLTIRDKTGVHPTCCNSSPILQHDPHEGKVHICNTTNGLTIFIAEVPADATLPTAPLEPYIGLDHLGLRVDDVDAATAELKRRGAQMIV